ncbi:MAG TPA: phosphodiester glycosidase family protein [Polyangiaceae bacterium]|nr:phosphodiester glycosidase family protein [Polyangiaceae bacterium]
MAARSFLRSRRYVALLTVVAALAVRAIGHGPPAPTVEGLSELLGNAVGGTVKPGELAWEPSPGFLTEVFSGRPLLFLAAPRDGAPRDLYRAWIRLTADGKPVSVSRVRNITDTPDGDDAALEARGDKALFATLAFGRIQAISVLDLWGIRASDQPTSLLDRLLLSLSSFQQTGSFAGIGRTDIVLDVPASRATMELDPKRLQVDLGEQGRELSYDLERRTVRNAEGGEAYAARAVPQIYGSKPFVFWAVDTVRAEVGPEPIAWLENKVFGAKDSVKRTTYALFASKEDRELAATAGSAEPVAQVLDARAVGALADSWPPPRVPSIWKEPKANEGAWQPVTYPFLKPLRGLQAGGPKPAPYFYRTTIRPDKERPYAEVVLIAMDMRQLEIGMQAGYEDPKPTTGPPGEGRLPQEKEVYERVVATFNGAFKTTHGNYGMSINKRVLLPPVPGGASVVVTEDSAVGMGSWPQNTEVPKHVISFRQNLDPLVEDGVANPTGRNIWGWQLEGTGAMTQRTALCVTSAGHLYYAFAEEIDGPTLGKALRQAGCSYAMHLDMNPGHCGFVFTDIISPKTNNYQLRLADDAMKMSPDRYVRWSPKDFFYVTSRTIT